MTNEEIYDTEIAPKLLLLVKRCAELEMSFIASVEFDASTAGIGRTEYRQQTEPVRKISSAQKLVHMAANCQGNVDKLIWWIMRDAEKYGHSSVCLQQLGCKNIQHSENEIAVITVLSPST